MGNDFEKDIKEFRNKRWKKVPPKVKITVIILVIISSIGGSIAWIFPIFFKNRKNKTNTTIGVIPKGDRSVGIGEIVNSTVNINTGDVALLEKEHEVPEGDIIVKDEHKNFDDGADVFGIQWNKRYSLHTITIKNKSKNKSMRQFSLFLGFKAKMLHKDLVLNNGAAGIKEGKNISIDMEIKGPLDKSEKPETKVISMKPANTFNIEIEEFFPEGSVTFRVILDNNDPQEVFYNIKYYYELGKELKKAAFFGNLSKDKPYVKSPNLN